MKSHSTLPECFMTSSLQIAANAVRIQGAVESMDTSLLALRLLRRLLVVGFEHPHRDPKISELWPSLINQLGRMLKLVSNDSDLTLELQNIPRRLVERHLMQIAKLHLNMARNHPTSFVLLPQSLDLVKSYCKCFSPSFERFWIVSRHFPLPETLSL